MDSEGSLIQVAFELEAGGLDELLVFRFVGNVRYLPRDVGAAYPLQIGVEIAVRAGQQAGRFRRGVLAQYNGQCDGSHNQHEAEQNGESASYAHEATTVRSGRTNDAARRSGSTNDTTRRWRPSVAT